MTSTLTHEWAPVFTTSKRADWNSNFRLTVWPGAVPLELSLFNDSITVDTLSPCCSAAIWNLDGVNMNSSCALCGTPCPRKLSRTWFLDETEERGLAPWPGLPGLDSFLASWVDTGLELDPLEGAVVASKTYELLMALVKPPEGTSHAGFWPIFSADDWEVRVDRAFEAIS